MRFVTFEDSEMRQCDFYAARMESSRFFGCDLSEAQFSRAETPGVRFHGSDLSDLKGADSLAGAVIDSSQVLPVALGVLAAHRIHIDDDREPSTDKTT